MFILRGLLLLDFGRLFLRTIPLVLCHREPWDAPVDDTKGKPMDTSRNGAALGRNRTTTGFSLYTASDPVRRR